VGSNLVSSKATSASFSQRCELAWWLINTWYGLTALEVKQTSAVSSDTSVTNADKAISTAKMAVLVVSLNKAECSLPNEQI
jgi:hypothetical protein